jgi:hypothetical protein
MTTVYVQALNDFSRKFILRGVYRPTIEDKILYRSRLENIKSSVFESFMLFDRTCFKVVGENVPLAVLVNEVGIKGLDRLVEQDALGFLHCKSMVGHMVDNIPAILPLVSGKHDNGPYVDPEESIAIGLKVLRDQPNKKQRQSIIRKVRDLYEDPEEIDGFAITEFVMSAFNAGKLKPYGLDNDLVDIYNLSRWKKEELAKCAEDLLEYKQILAGGLTSLDNSKFSALFGDTADKINIIQPAKAVSIVAELEGFPDLKAVYNAVDNPLQRAVGLREKRNVEKFRKWLENAPNDDVADLSRAYLDAIANPTGFFETKSGKFTKSLAMTIIGAGVGIAAAPVASATTAVVGAVAGKLIEPAFGVALDLVDEYLISGFTKGWTPRMFFSEIARSKIRIEPSVS